MFALPCADRCEGIRGEKDRRFHITCLWCRQRRHYTPKRIIRYGYLSMESNRTYAYQIDYEHKRIYRFIVDLPRYLLIDASGHCTMLRCCAVVALDRLAAKVGLRGCHPLANLFEFLANYPRW